MIRIEETAISGGASKISCSDPYGLVCWPHINACLEHRLMLATHPTDHSRIPSSRFLGYMLGISGTEGYRHMRRLLEETGVATETRGIGKARRVYVVSLERGA